MELPIKFHEHIQLINVGIHPTTICFENVTMASDKYIVVREMVGDSQQIVIIDMNDPANPQRHPISGDSVIMHPSRKILALKTGKTLQILDIEKKSKVKSHRNVKEVEFWRWINEHTIAFISDKAAYHWTIDGDSAPQKVFDRHTSLIGTQIIDYRADYESKWLAAISISTNGDQAIQLFSIEKKISQPIKGLAACLTQFKLGSNPYPSNLLCVLEKGEDEEILRISEIGQVEKGNQAFSTKAIRIPSIGDTASALSVFMQVSSQHGVIYVVTEDLIHICEIERETKIYSYKFLTKIVECTECTKTGGIIVVNLDGKVFSISIDESDMVHFLTKELQAHADLVLSLASRWNNPRIDSILAVVQKVKSLDLKRDV